MLFAAPIRIHKRELRLRNDRHALRQLGGQDLRQACRRRHLQNLQTAENFLMGCKCPDDVPLFRGSCSYLVYSDGPVERFYRLIAQVIPDNAELTHARPIVHDDGSLEFPGEPPALSGYRRDGCRLCPVWPCCKMRMLKIQIVRGLLTVTGICGNPRMDDFGFEISLDQCQKCPFLKNAST
jgi:hypothetical protein